MDFLLTAVQVVAALLALYTIIAPKAVAQLQKKSGGKGYAPLPWMLIRFPGDARNAQQDRRVKVLLNPDYPKARSRGGVTALVLTGLAIVSLAGVDYVSARFVEAWQRSHVTAHNVSFVDIMGNAGFAAYRHFFWMMLGFAGCVALACILVGFIIEHNAQLPSGSILGVCMVALGFLTMANLLRSGSPVLGANGGIIAGLLTVVAWACLILAAHRVPLPSARGQKH